MAFELESAYFKANQLRLLVRSIDVHLCVMDGMKEDFKAGVMSVMPEGVTFEDYQVYLTAERARLVALRERLQALLLRY